MSAIEEMAIWPELGCCQAIWPHSGHYRPTEENFQEFKSFLNDNLVDLLRQEAAAAVDAGTPVMTPVATNLVVEMQGRLPMLQQGGEEDGAAAHEPGSGGRWRPGA
ncbi:hypothetical protein CFC21_026212 [Triticum aestivum]|uniref:Uncharacterized protein n=2 Tax=Triticum aestivum TaxID=4565 RepID=A0A9R1EK49_WHEAT|nr:hypothetical protein CFC21_026212 [Triticum aestivum]